MKIVPIALASFGLLLGGGILTAADALTQVREVIVASPEKAEFKEVVPGVSRALIAGNPEKGPYRAFTRFDPGVTREMHAHPHDIDLVVLTGTFVYKSEKGEEIRVAAGSYMHVPANDRHTASADAKLGVLFFEESSGPFEPVKIPK